MSAFSKNLFDLLGDGDNEAPAAPAPAAAKPVVPAPAVKEQAAARPKSEKAKRGGKSDGRQTFQNFISSTQSASKRPTCTHQSFSPSNRIVDSSPNNIYYCCIKSSVRFHHGSL
jgi:Stm1